ncbi:NADH dehydrogenase, partial [Lamprotornis superbus]
REARAQRHPSGRTTAGGARCRFRSWFRFRFRAAALTRGGREAGRCEPAARPKMAEYVQLLKRALKHIGGHGGARGAMLQLLRVNDLKTGNLIGIDKYGNKYYEDKRNFFGRHRWVVYTEEMNGKNTFWEVDGSMVPPEWHRWLHSMTDDPPTTHPPVARKFIWENHKFNVSGTPEQYVPYSTTRKKIHDWSTVRFEHQKQRGPSSFPRANLAGAMQPSSTSDHAAIQRGVSSLPRGSSPSPALL